MLNTPSARWHALLTDHVLPLALYLTLALLMTWPMALQITTAVPGNGFDTWQNMWNMWWLRQALLTATPPYFTPYLYYPHGASLLLQTLNPINFLVSLPIHALFGLIVAFNFVVLFSLTMSGYTTYLLARAVLADTDQGAGARWRAALLAGVIFANSGYLLSQVLGSHTHMLAAWPLPLAVLALRRAATAPAVGRVMLAGGLMALTVLSDWQYLLFTLIWGVWYACALLLFQPRAPEASAPVERQVAAPWWRRVRARLVASGAPAVIAASGLALLLVLPLAVPTARFSAQVPTAETEGGANFRLEHSADLADFFIPSQIHPLLGRLAEQLQAYKSQTHIQNKTVYLGVVSLVLAGFGLRGRRGRFWLLSALLFAILAMGPQLQVFGWFTGIPLPGALLYELPLVRISRYPLRFTVYTMLALAMLAALGAQRGFAALEQRARRPHRASNLALAGLVGLVALENLTTPFPLVRVAIPPLYAALGRDPAQYAILESPFYYNTSPVYMLYQVVHGKYLVGGYTSRRLPYPLVDQIPTIRMFAYAQPAPDIIAQDPAEIAASVFSYFDIRYLMLHSAGGTLRYSELETVALAAADGSPPEIQDSSLQYSDTRSASGLLRSMGPLDQPPAGSVLAYRVMPPATPLPFLGIGAGWSPPAQSPAGLERQITAEAELLIYSAAPQQITLTLLMSSPAAGELDISVNGQAHTTLALAGGEAHHELVLPIEAGITRLLLHPVAAAPLVVRSLAIAPSP